MKLDLPTLGCPKTERTSPSSSCDDVFFAFLSAAAFSVAQVRRMETSPSLPIGIPGFIPVVGVAAAAAAAFPAVVILDLNKTTSTFLFPLNSALNVRIHASAASRGIRSTLFNTINNLSVHPFFAVESWPSRMAFSRNVERKVGGSRASISSTQTCARSRADWMVGRRVSTRSGGGEPASCSTGAGTDLAVTGLTGTLPWSLMIPGFSSSSSSDSSLVTGTGAALAALRAALTACLCSSACGDV